MENKIKALIVDDELNICENLTEILKDFCPQVEIIKIATTLPEAEQDIKALSPELVFMDIQIGTRMIFEMLETLEINFEIIFISAHNHALDAFKFTAIDYILKPIDIITLKNAVEKAIFNIRSQLFSKNIKEFIKTTKKDHYNIAKIAVPIKNGYQMIRIDQILYCKAEGSYTYIYMSQGNHIIVSKNLGYYEELLKPHNFLRIHNSNLVNSSYIKEISKSEGGYVIMDNGTTLSISKSRREETFYNLNLK
ncbi:LytTR family DNA-binding domain-containing protein [uncultured Aquimarina sp.]|uniref:LytR/AlgR family response regulator transcription factor n=1 Tax=uncultured Aquimarina sp. TaxID=575652 RepID=UPI002616F113|nr:LytTR family DNA-binding domain-containing protein [uncultured Aquimarina sp.]